ncbi:MAG: 50S ribosomal protein L20 [Candidatus Omnitrophica bacterium]|nr:50S ribosomal protein L20 [Candidatus Omnitrophota bacterium]
MARVRRAPARKQRHKKIFQMAKGFRGGRGKLYRTALETVRRALVYSYRDRKVKKRVFRRLWIMRMSVACKDEGISYSRLIYGLNKAGLELNRKQLAEMAVNDREGFRKIVALAKDHIG